MSAGNEAPRLSWRQRVCTCFVPRPKSQFSARFHVGYLFAFSRSARGRQTTEAAPARTPTLGWSPQNLKVGSFRKNGQTVRPGLSGLQQNVTRNRTSTPAKLSGLFSCTHSRPAAV